MYYFIRSIVIALLLHMFYFLKVSDIEKIRANSSNIQHLIAMRDK